MKYSLVADPFLIKDSFKTFIIELANFLSEDFSLKIKEALLITFFTKVP